MGYFSTKFGIVDRPMTISGDTESVQDTESVAYILEIVNAFFTTKTWIYTDNQHKTMSLEKSGQKTMNKQCWPNIELRNPHNNLLYDHIVVTLLFKRGHLPVYDTKQ